MDRIAVLTSGGDAPGMNAATRAVTRVALAAGASVCGVSNGFRGLVEGTLRPLGARDVGGIIQRGGTVLGTSRCPEFRTEAGRARALQTLEKNGIEGLVVIGGNGSQQGSHALAGTGFPVVGVASTIDNDLAGTEITIGVDTALNVALEAIDRLKVTASSHRRAFLVEVMGRRHGYLALMAGIAGGAEAVVLPETETEPAALAEQIRVAYERGKPHALVVVAEGATWTAAQLASHFEEHERELGFELRITILGHVQRGAVPTAADRLLASRLGGAAADALISGERSLLVGWQRGAVSTSPLAEVIAQTKSLDPELLRLAGALAQ
ncbi:MAG: 6-phosphofructokinase [Candidatus Bipolaricaulota bacterium]|nr:MAG: 6-phosphofructokinase [Candidatus Bipolaricaulota bacterium]